MEILHCYILFTYETHETREQVNSYRNFKLKEINTSIELYEINMTFKFEKKQCHFFINYRPKILQ